MHKAFIVFLSLIVLCVVFFIVLQYVKGQGHETHSRHILHSVIHYDYKDYIALIASLTSTFVALAFILDYCQGTNNRMSGNGNTNGSNDNSNLNSNTDKINQLLQKVEEQGKILLQLQQCKCIAIKLQ